MSTFNPTTVDTSSTSCFSERSAAFCLRVAMSTGMTEIPSSRSPAAIEGRSSTVPCPTASFRPDRTSHRRMRPSFPPVELRECVRSVPAARRGGRGTRLAVTAERSVLRQALPGAVHHPGRRRFTDGLSVAVGRTARGSHADPTALVPDARAMPRLRQHSIAERARWEAGPPGRTALALITVLPKDAPAGL